ncbi:unnamed protein product [Allacma fusca]|uniref:Uncharacterized protein n=1 Tax=Allacma fusca TaxID=39272 RepID=A0A8J2L360_9HEXA|nr:unnamed protein product [Allacma fusca]
MTYKLNILPTTIDTFILQQFLLIMKTVWFLFTATLVLHHGSASPIEIPAMSRYAFIGEFFNATAGNFTGGMIFNKALPPQLHLIRENDNSYTETSYTIYDSLQEKISFLKVSASVAIEVKIGNVEVGVTGKAAFIQDEKSSRRHVEGVLVHNTLTKKESIELTIDEVRPYVSTEILENSNATHVVTGIYYGGDVYIKFVDTNVENHNNQEISGALEMTLKLPQLAGNATGELNITSSDVFQAFNYSLEVFGDVPIHKIPTNAHEVQQLIHSIPAELAKVNYGKGVPLRYILTPVSELREAFKLDRTLDKIVYSLDEDKLERIMVTLNEISEVRQTLNDLSGSMDDHSEIVPPPERKRLRQLVSNFEKEALAFQANVREALILVRTHGSQELLTSVYGNYIRNEFAPESIRGKLRYEFEATERKIPFYRNFLKRGFTYLGKSNSLGPYLIHAQSSLVYVVYFSIGLIEANMGIWEENRELLGYIDPDWSSIAVLDCDFWRARCADLNHTVIQGYFKGRLGTYDARLDMPLRDESLKVLPATGGTNAIGDLYDARTGKFSDESIFLTTRSHDKIKSLPSKTVGSCTSVETYGWEGILTELQTPAEFGFLLYSGDILPEGSGEVFLPVYNPPINHTASLVCISKSVVDSLNTTADQSLFDLLDMATITRSTATHFIEKIEFGASTFITFNHTDPVKAKAEADRWQPAVERNLTSKPHKNVVVPDVTESQMKLFSDISPRFIHELQTKEMIEFLKDSPDARRTLNDGKGVPVFYYLRPISVLKKNFAVASLSVSVPPEDEKLKRGMVAHCGKMNEPRTCIRTRFDFFDEVKQESVGYVHDFDSFSEAFGQTESSTLHFLLFKYQWIDNENIAWILNKGFLFNDIKAGIRFVVDCNFFEGKEAHSVCEGVMGPAIFKYENGEVVSRDFAKEGLNKGTIQGNMTEEQLKKQLDEEIMNTTERFNTLARNLTETSELVGSLMDISNGLNSRLGTCNVFTPPRGFVYAQRGPEAMPAMLWNASTWRDISSAYPSFTSVDKLWEVL